MTDTNQDGLRLALSRLTSLKTARSEAALDALAERLRSLDARFVAHLRSLVEEETR